MITIKHPASKDDFRAYYALRYHVEREAGGHPRGTEKDDYEPISQHFMAVDEAGAVVGVARLVEKEPGEGLLGHLAVDEDHERQGIGRLLVQAVEVEARGLGYKSLGVLSHQATIEFLERQGFQIKGLHTNPFGNAQLLWMEKDL
jgi:N-acetylglutamate synthase-like GNAT family acetyltransferase